MPKPKTFYSLSLFLSTFLLSLIFNSLLFAEESITITTYYPSPYGVYNELTTYNNTLLATQGGRVGIGTTNLRAKLDVGSGPAGGDIFLGYNYTGASGIRKNFSTAHAAGNVPSAFTFGMGDGSYAGITVSDVRDGSFNSQFLSFDTHHGGVSAGTRMTIDKDGNVGIGTPSPNSLLHLSKNDPVQNRIILDNPTSGKNVQLIQYGATGNGILWAGFDSANTASLVSTAPLVIRSENGLIFSGSGNAEHMQITTGGNVGIGTTSPAGKLDVNGTIYQRGAVLHADYVFEPDYKLESIKDHAQYMWENKHLKAVPKAKKDKSGQDIVEIGSLNRGVLEELEKAHVYIQQLNERLKKQEDEIMALRAEVKGLRVSRN